MNKYLHITLALVLLVSFGLSAKSNPEKGEPVKPNAKRAEVAVPAQNVLDWQICIFVKVALERPHSQSRTAGMQSCGSGGQRGIFVRPFSMVLDIIIRQK